MVHQPDERERGGDLLAVVQLRRLSEIHREAGIQERIKVEVFFFQKELEEKLVEPPVHVPVDVPQVVADRVISVVGELDRRTPPLALSLPLHPPDEDFLAHQLKLFELVEEFRVEQGGGRGR